MKALFWFFFFFLPCLFHSGVAYSMVSAREVFRLLPPTIFESTAAGLSEGEKEQLIQYGFTEAWLVRESGPDLLRIESVPDGETVVLLRLFRKKDSVLAVVGTDFALEAAEAGSEEGEKIAPGGLEYAIPCATELWSMDKKGRIAPAPTPPDPPLWNFFRAGKSPPVGVQASMFFCVREDGLAVLPVFEGSRGAVRVAVDYSIHYIWEGQRFQKRIKSVP